MGAAGGGMRSRRQTVSMAACNRRRCTALERERWRLWASCYQVRRAPGMSKHHFHLTHAIDRRSETGIEPESIHSAKRRAVKTIAQPAPALWQTPLRNGALLDGLLQLATPAGLEPATTRLEGGCSIQLSYGVRCSLRVLVGFTAVW
jgi:hypothetical protein